MNDLAFLISQRIISSFGKSESASNSLVFYILKDRNPIGGSEYCRSVAPGSVFCKSSNKNGEEPDPKWTSSSVVLCIQRQQNNFLAICALCAIESLSTSLSYIQWIETTGMCQPRNAQSGITKALIKALIDYSRENNQTLALFSSGHKRPQPFFFRKTVSSKLHPKQLESWWRFLFENQSGSSLCSWSPSVDNRKCPLPFAVANEERDANEVVPLFPDDPMSRHLSTFDNEPIELSTFLESLSYRPEYVGGAGTHFWLSPSPNCYSPHCEPNQGGPALNRWIDSVFCKIDFSSIALAYESTNILIDAIEKIHNGGEEIEVVRFSVSNLDLHARAKDSFYTNKSAIDQTSPPINNIQKLIRKNKST